MFKKTESNYFSVLHSAHSRKRRERKERKESVYFRGSGRREEERRRKEREKGWLERMYKKKECEEIIEKGSCCSIPGKMDYFVVKKKPGRKKKVVSK